MEKHRGATVERIVRRSGISIAELARRINVNRRSLYNWFEQEQLSMDSIYKIGHVLGYDFTEDFPELKEFPQFQIFPKAHPVPHNQLEQSVSYWKNKYIHLLEKYNEQLINSRIYEQTNADLKEAVA